MALRLLQRDGSLKGLDNLSEPCDVNPKGVRPLQSHSGFRFGRIDLSDRRGMRERLERERPNRS